MSVQVAAQLQELESRGEEDVMGSSTWQQVSQVR